MFVYGTDEIVARPRQIHPENLYYDVFNIMKIAYIPEFIPKIHQTELFRNDKMLNRLLYDGLLPQIYHMSNILQDFDPLSVVSLLLNTYVSNEFGVPSSRFGRVSITQPIVLSDLRDNINDGQYTINASSMHDFITSYMSPYGEMANDSINAASGDLAALYVINNTAIPIIQTCQELPKLSNASQFINNNLLGTAGTTFGFVNLVRSAD